MIQAIIAGNETESVDASRMLSMKIVMQQNATFGDASEWVYRGKNAITPVTMITAINPNLKKTQNIIQFHFISASMI